MDDGDPRGAVALVVAHPDDVANTMAGTALLLASRHPLHVLCASRGERGYRWSGAGAPPPDRALGRRREAEERAACAELGASLQFLDQIDGEIEPSRAAVADLAARLRAIAPCAVFTHHPLEKADHAAVHLLTWQALAASGLGGIEVLMPVWGGGTWHPARADAVVDIGSVVERKRRMIAVHRSQHPDDAVVERVLRRGRDLGACTSCVAAEAWVVANGPRSGGSALLRPPGDRVPVREPQEMP